MKRFIANVFNHEMIIYYKQLLRKIGVYCFFVRIPLKIGNYNKLFLVEEFTEGLSSDLHLYDKLICNTFSFFHFSSNSY